MTRDFWRNSVCCSFCCSYWFFITGITRNNNKFGFLVENYLYESTIRGVTMFQKRYNKKGNRSCTWRFPTKNTILARLLLVPTRPWMRQPLTDGIWFSCCIAFVWGHKSRSWKGTDASGMEQKGDFYEKIYIFERSSKIKTCSKIFCAEIPILHVSKVLHNKN